jgi:hypothetical protein
VQGNNERRANNYAFGIHEKESDENGNNESKNSKRTK